MASDASEAVPQQSDSGITDTNQHDADEAQQALHMPSQHSDQEKQEQQEPLTSPQLEIVSEHAFSSELKQHQAAVDTVNTNDAVEHASQVSHEPALQPQQQEQLTASSDTESTTGSVIITDTEAVAQILAAVDSGTEEPELEQRQAEEQEATDSATNDSTVATATGTSPDIHQSQSVPQQDDTLQQLENGHTEPAGSQPGISAADRREPAPESSQPMERVNGVDSVDAADSREDMLEQESQKPVSAVQQGSPVAAAQQSMPGS